MPLMQPLKRRSLRMSPNTSLAPLRMQSRLHVRPLPKIRRIMRVEKNVRGSGHICQVRFESLCSMTNAAGMIYVGLFLTLDRFVESVPYAILMKSSA